MYKFSFSFYRTEDFSYMSDVFFDSVVEGICFGYKSMTILPPCYTELEICYQPVGDTDSWVRGMFRVSRADVMSLK